MYTDVMEISWLIVSEEYRRRGIASGLLTAITQEIFSLGKVTAYHAGSAGKDLDSMLIRLGYQEIKSCYRFIPSSAEDQWRTTWGKLI
jgi:predicted GNAT family acetyltransferase